VAVRALQAEGRARRILVVDCDVHQGDGTAAIFAGDSSVFTFSIHGAKNFPLHKERSDLDIELPDGTIVTGKNSPLMHAASSVVINAVKRLAGLPQGMHLLAPTIIECVAKVKKDILGQKTVSLDLEETLIALGISVTTNPSAQLCLDKLKSLRGCDVHMTHIPAPGDEAGLRQLGVHLTSDPNFSTKNLFVS